MRNELTRLARFCAVGVTNTAVTLVAFGLLSLIGTAAPAASALAFGAGAVNGYLLNRRWTFRGAAGGAATMARYVTVQALGAALSAAGIAVAGADLSLPRLPAEALVLPFVTLVTYLLCRRLVFRGPALAGVRH
jgi:putative flippase GtrA